MPVKCPMPDSWCPLPDTSEMGKCPQCPVPAMPLPAMPAARYFCPPHITNSYSYLEKKSHKMWRLCIAWREDQLIVAVGRDFN